MNLQVSWKVDNILAYILLTFKSSYKCVISDAEMTSISTNEQERFKKIVKLPSSRNATGQLIMDQCIFDCNSKSKVVPVVN
jgi:hypothetical protein